MSPRGSCGHASDWVYLHAVCHPGAGTWLRIGPNGAHVLECRECRKMITAFRVLEGGAENITHEPGLTYEEAVEPFLDPPEIACHNCEVMFTFSPSMQTAVDAGWLQSGTTWACPSCRSAAILAALPPVSAEAAAASLNKVMDLIAADREECSFPRCREMATEMHTREKLFRGKAVLVRYPRCWQHPLAPKEKTWEDGGICGATHDSTSGLRICRRPAGHKGGCDYEPV